MAIHRHQASTVEAIDGQFYRDVMQGLSSSPKYLQSKYFYDEEGDRLFQQIMGLPEYYLTRCEKEIMVGQRREISYMLTRGFEEFDVLELGAGDATKSTFLLRQLQMDAAHRFVYHPIDISDNVIQMLHREMPQRVRGLEVEGLTGDYFQMISRSYKLSSRPKIVFFLGATIGNYTPEQALSFLQLLSSHLRSGDRLLIGFDLKKHPRQILSAYNDKAGVTRAFNLNLLHRMNRELDANFNVDCFDHYPTYDPATGACKSYLISLEEQEVQIGGEPVHFDKDEHIWTELSQKYAENEIADLAFDAGFTPLHNFYDSRGWFVDAVWRKR